MQSYRPCIRPVHQVGSARRHPCLPRRSHTFLRAFSFGPALPTFVSPAAAAATKAAAHALALEVIQDRLVVSAPIHDATIEELIDLLPPTLHHLELSRARRTVPESLGKFTALRTLKLSGREWLTALPKSVGDLGALQTLDLSGCTNLRTLPTSILQLTQLDEDSRERVEARLRGAPTTL
jgi:hypothetical protein